MESGGQVQDGWERVTGHAPSPCLNGCILPMVSKNHQVLAPCGGEKTMASLIFGQFRPFRGFGILFLQCEAFPDRVGGLWQKPVFPLFQSNEKRHASDSGFRIRRRQLPEMKRAVRGQRVPRGRGMRRVRIFWGKSGSGNRFQCVCIQNLAKVRINKETVRGQKVDAEDRFRNCSQNERAEKSPDAKIQCFLD